MCQMKISFLNGRHIVEGGYFIPERLWGDHKSYILKRLIELFYCLIVHLLLTLAPTTYPDDCL